MFKDEAVITIRSGAGGPGCVSFRREKFMPRGGPDGGDGGRGGDVVIAASSDAITLLDYVRHPKREAQNGDPGTSNECTGRDAETLRLEVPIGTIVHDVETGELVADLDRAGASVVLAHGGKGGRGNKWYASAVNQAPRVAGHGEPGKARTLRLDLKLIADVGIVGMPNAGKSTLLSRVSAARPKIADYPFTTLEPNLGIVDLEDARQVVLADIPGLIEGAHAGTGLGDRFLRHVERTRVLLHLVDASPLAALPADEAYRVVRNEIAAYSPRLAEKPELVVATKMDLPGSEAGLAALRKAAQGDVVAISAPTGKNLKALMSKVLDLLARAAESEPEASVPPSGPAAATGTGKRPRPSE